MEQPSVSLSDLPALKKAFAQAVTSGKTEFQFKGTTLLVAYAKYLIEYMNSIASQQN